MKHYTPGSVAASLSLDAGSDDITVLLPHLDIWYQTVRSGLTPLANLPKRRPRGFRTAGGGKLGAKRWEDALTNELESATTLWQSPDTPVTEVLVHVYRIDNRFLTLHVLADTHDPATEHAAAEALIAVLRTVGDRIDVLHGEATGPGNRGQAPFYTALDMALHRGWTESLTESRRFLRGYSWVTLCPADLAVRLGGAEAMAATGAFTEVVPLAAGGLLLRATTKPGDWTPALAGEVFEALRPVLPPGLPRIYAHTPLDYIVVRDASR